MLQRLPQLSDTRARRFRTSRLLEDKRPDEETAEPILLVKLSKPPPSPETTMEVTTGQIEVSEDARFIDVKEGDSLLAPIDLDEEQTLEVEEPTAEVTVKRDSLLAPIDLDDEEQTIPKVRLPGPPALPSFDIDPDGEDTTQKAEVKLPSVTPPKRKPWIGERPQDEVLFCLEGEDAPIDELIDGIQQIEDERVLDEMIEKEEEELNEKRRELLAVIVAAKEKKIADEAAKKKAAREAAIKAEADAKKAEEERKAAERAEAERKEEETVEEIEIDVELGIEWTDEHTTYKLNERELVMCKEVLPERARLWILPMPEGTNEQEQIVLETCRDELKVKLAGQRYYILKEPFAGSKSVARVGNVLNVWPESLTNYEFLGNIGAEVREYREVEWPKGFCGYDLTKRELGEVELYIPEDAPRLLHPVPDVNTKNPRNLEILGMCKDSSIITLGENQYYIFNIHSMAVWKDVVTKLPKSRIVSRKEDALSIWGEERNGRKILEGIEMPSETKDTRSIPPVPPNGRVIPHSEEIPSIEEMYAGGKRKYLVQMLERVGDMDIEAFVSVSIMAHMALEKNGRSPFVSIQGKWYLALDLPHPISGTRETVYENGVIRGVRQETPAQGMERLREQNRINLERKRKLDEIKREFLKNFPEGETRYMQAVPADLESKLPEVEMPDGNGGKTRYLIHNEPVEGGIPVVRKGENLHKASGNDPQSEL
ncbi:hypothetical protein KKE38_04170 [Candidatus Micrarchaeota archaeon]|nr:hypothetical protein [Candidatus Micrarchaeota archaeon]